MNHDELLAHYRSPGIFTSVEGFEAELDRVPSDIRSIAVTVQGLLIHGSFDPAYGIAISDSQQGTQLHTAIAMLRHANRLNSAPPIDARSRAQRVAGVCRHFATLAVAIMRHKGIPARARCGFANYFDPEKNTDHWVAEYWNSVDERWVLTDTQVDGLQRAMFEPSFDTLDVPRDRFLVAGDAWQLCRTGNADPLTFGVAGTENWGIVEVFGDIMQDLAALQKIELLPWGWYGLALDQPACEKESALVDRLADVSSRADAASLDVLRSMIATDSRLGVPAETIAAITSAESAAV